MKPFIATLTAALAVAAALLTLQRHNLAALEQQQSTLEERHSELRQIVATLPTTHTAHATVAEPTTPLTAEELITQAEASLTDNDPAVIPRLTARIKSAPTSELRALIPAMFTEENEKRASQATGAIVMALMAELAKRDPHWIFDYFINHERGGAMMAGSILAAIANESPQTALEIFQDNRKRLDGSGARMAVATIAAKLARTDLPSALSLIEDLEIEQRDTVLRAVVGTAGGAGKDPELLEAIDALGDNGLRTNALALLLQQQVAQQGFDAVAPFSKKHGLDITGQNHLLLNLAYSQTIDRPVEAADYVITHSHPDHRLKNIESFIGSWAENDYNAAAAYLQNREPGIETDHAIAAFARRITPKEPESAIDWAKSIKDPEIQKQTLTKILTRWQSDDPAAAAAFVDAKPK